MTFAAGQKLTATDLNNHTWRTLEALATASPTVTTTVADVAGATLTFTTPVDNTVVKVQSYWDVSVTGGTDLFIGTLYVDGVAETSGEAHFEGAGSERCSIAQGWDVTLASAGSHTLKLRAQKANNSDTVTLFSTHTKIIVEGLGIS